MPRASHPRTPTSPSPPRVRDNRPTCCGAGPILLAAQAQLDAANARRQQAMAEWFPRLLLGAVFGGEGLSVNGMALGAARFTNVAALIAMPIFNAGRTQAINDIAESGQKEALLRYEDAIVRALEDVENTLVALDAGATAGTTAAKRRRLRPKPRSVARSRSTTAVRSTCCRCSMRSARACRCGSAPTTPTRNCCSTACNCTRRSAAAGRCSSLRRRPRRRASNSPNS